MHTYRHSAICICICIHVSIYVKRFAVEHDSGYVAMESASFNIESVIIASAPCLSMGLRVKAVHIYVYCYTLLYIAIYCYTLLYTHIYIYICIYTCIRCGSFAFVPLFAGGNFTFPDQPNTITWRLTTPGGSSPDDEQGV